MKGILIFTHSNNPQEADKVARYYLFIKWLKIHYKEYFLLYGIHFTIPFNDLQIMISPDYIASEDKQKMQKIVDEFNMIVFD